MNAPEAVHSDTSLAIYQRIGIVTGPAACALMLLLGENQETMPDVAWRVAAVGMWMAIWWATEAIPVPATGFIPLVVFDLFGIAPMKEAAQSYAHPIIYLFLGAFVLALAVEKWSLHRRIALWILSRTGTDGKRLILGFMVVAALLSMWMTNTSTTMMLLPIAVSVAGLIADQTLRVNDADARQFQIALMLALAYSTTIGGLSTLVGTPPNILLAAFLEDSYGITIAFADWMMIGVPLTVVLLPLGWWLLTSIVFKVNIPASEQAQQMIVAMREDLGEMSKAEKRVGMVFLLVVLLWMSRSMLAELPGLSGLSDTGIVMAAALLLFVVPNGDIKGGALMSWPDVARLPWGVLVLFGGGLSLAAQVSDSGLANWLGEGLAPLASLGTLVLVLASAGLVVFLTELTSNLATAATFLPVVGAIALQMGIDPLVLCVPVTLAASCAFMLPVATPPNAIVFASGVLRISDMIRAGFVMNIVSLCLLTAAAVWLVPLVLG
ncbi:DASS family sodium-coupled anion symporter [Congregibacter variabilis]|uniref:DASS family sodium-coupled anion symporter n=1 Tax=Congregibacter variabilis TaxID=3081200 RepID=A0ABZ0I3N4_9GAMM|nr:DASS family sodium-coupled anion symporter [Congregibacter sp. IMCC43200]